MILIAEDDRDVSSLVSTFLSSRGFATAAAFDATQAIMLAMRTPPTAIVLDINMPGGSGLNVLRRVKQSAKTSQVPVIVLTATTDPHVRRTVAQLGADAFEEKPPDLPKLERTLRRLLGQAEPAAGPIVGGEASDAELQAALSGARNRLIAEFPALAVEVCLATVGSGPGPRSSSGSLPQELTSRVHNLAGRAGTLGFGTLGALAAELERQMRAADRGVVDRVAVTAALRALCDAFAADVLGGEKMS